MAGSPSDISEDLPDTQCLRDSVNAQNHEDLFEEIDRLSDSLLTRQIQNTPHIQSLLGWSHKESKRTPLTENRRQISQEVKDTSADVANICCQIAAPSNHGPEDLAELISKMAFETPGALSALNRAGVFPNNIDTVHGQIEDLSKRLAQVWQESQGASSKPQKQREASSSMQRIICATLGIDELPDAYVPVMEKVNNETWKELTLTKRTAWTESIKGIPFPSSAAKSSMRLIYEVITDRKLITYGDIEALAKSLETCDEKTAAYTLRTIEVMLEEMIKRGVPAGTERSYLTMRAVELLFYFGYSSQVLRSRVQRLLRSIVVKADTPKDYLLHGLKDWLVLQTFALDDSKSLQYQIRSLAAQDGKCCIGNDNIALVPQGKDLVVLSYGSCAIQLVQRDMFEIEYAEIDRDCRSLVAQCPTGILKMSPLSHKQFDLIDEVFPDLVARYKEKRGVIWAEIRGKLAEVCARLAK